MQSLNSNVLLAAQLGYVGRKVPYFKELGCNDGRPIEGFPFCFKQQIRNNYAAFISDDFSAERGRLADFLMQGRIRDHGACGPHVEEIAYDANIIVSETTGTSGTVLRCPKTMADRFRLGIGTWRQRRSIDSTVKPNKLFPLSHYGLATPLVDPWNCELSNLKVIYGQLIIGSYTWLHCPWDLLQRHVEVFRRDGWRPIAPSLQFIEFMGYSPDREVIADLCAFFNAKYVDHYGMLETWTVAMSCRHGLLHINEHNVYVEIIDDAGQPVRLGEAGRLVVTSLQETLLPFIRYVTDDFGKFVKKRCNCQLGTKALVLIEGRSWALIKGVPGRIFGTGLFRGVLKDINYAEDKIGHLELTCIHIRQVAIKEFIIETNAIRAPDELLNALSIKTSLLLGGHVQFHHVVLSNTEISIRERQKPWLFRCEC